jgi:hypothetical protein
VRTIATLSEAVNRFDLSGAPLLGRYLEGSVCASPSISASTRKS